MESTLQGSQAGDVERVRKAVQEAIRQDPLVPGGAEIGVAGQLHPRLAGRWKLRQPVFVAELLLEPLLEALERMRGRLRYRPIPKLPAVERDLSLVLDRHISFAQVRAAIEAAGTR